MGRQRIVPAVQCHLGESADGCRIDGVAPSNIGLSLTISEPHECFLALMSGELARPTESDTAFLGALSAGISAGED
jgi:hypothetical protein